MQRFQKTQPKKKKLPAPVLALFLIVLLLVLLSSIIQLVRKQVRIGNAIRQLRSEQAALIKKQKTLAATVEYLQTEEGKEQALRDKYRLVKPGEGIVVITDPPEPPDPTQQQPRNFFERLIGAVKSLFSKE